jgi:hypothetical protein
MKTSKKLNTNTVSKTQVRDMIKSLMTVEKQVKHTFLEYAFNPTTTPVLIVPVTYPAQGVAAYNTDETETSQGQRIGNKIVPQWWDYVLTIYDSTAGTESVCRIIIFEWLLPVEHSDMVPVVGDIFADGSSSYFYDCPLNFDNRTKYHILYDKCHTLVTGSVTQVIHLKLHFTQKDFAVKEWKFIGDSQSGVTAALVKGNLYAFFVSDGAIETPDVQFTSYMGYTD